MTNKPIEKNLDNIRHSLAHLLAAAVLKKFPNAKLGIGPTIQNGFYYDFDVSKGFTPEDLIEFEKEMRNLIKAALSFSGEKLTPSKAKTIFSAKGGSASGGNYQPFKLDLIKEFVKEKKQLTLYKTGDIFYDLCKGGHTANTKEINPDAFKLTHTAGAYWRGSEKNPQLQRVYGVAFNTKEELDEYFKMMEEAEKRDHRKLGKELKLFTFSDYVGPGLPLWLPKGTIIIEELERLAKETEENAGYSQVRTPHIAKEEMYKTSGHLPYYADSMFPPLKLKEKSDSSVYYLKAMNCPHHHQIYASEPRSYRDLPLRLSEYGTVYRYEKSGELFGLMRSRMLSMNDAHIYCTANQFADEFNAVNEMYIKYFKIFGIEKCVMRFSTHDPKELGKKYIDDAPMWKKTENMVRKTLKESGIEYVEVPNEAAFYGPKIDVQIWSSIGHEYTLATNQIDFAVPKRFGLTYIDKNGKNETPLVIHRAPLGTHERFIGFLIEHFAGAFPLWLAPAQVKILAISEKHNGYAEKILRELKEAKIRAELTPSNETLGKRIREAQMQKIPYLLIVGDKEIQSDSVSVRHLKRGDEGTIKLDNLVSKVTQEIWNKNQ